MPPGGSCLERAARSLTRSDGGVLRGPEESAPAPRLPPVALTGRSSPSPPSSARQDRGAPAAFQKYRGDPTGGGVRPPMPPRAPMGTYGHAGGRAAAVYVHTHPSPPGCFGLWWLFFWLDFGLLWGLWGQASSPNPARGFLQVSPALRACSESHRLTIIIISRVLGYFICLFVCFMRHLFWGCVP